MATALPDTWRAADFFVLRTPLLSLATLRLLGDALTSPEQDGDPEAFARAAAADRARMRAVLLEVLSLPGVEEALYVASADLHDAMRTWRSDPHTPQGAKVELSLLKYVRRMASRSTPFGLFAGVSVGTIAARTALTLSDPAGWRRHAQLDSAIVERLAVRLGESEAVRRASAYVPNPTLYPAGGELRYYERTGSAYFLSQVESMPELELVLGAARGGARFDVLAATLEETGLPRDEAEGFLLELIDHGLLLSTLHPSATGPELADQLVAALEGSRLGDLPEAAALAAAQRGIARLNARPLGAEPEAYRDLRDTLRDAVPPAEGEIPWYLRLVKPGGGATLSTAMAREVARAVMALHLVNRGGERNPLAAFKEAFERRYEGEEVPLLLALDDEYGIGLDSAVDVAGDPLVRGLPLAPQPERQWQGEHLRLLATLHARGAATGEAVLTAADLDPLQGPGPALPDALAVLATCVRLENGEERLVVKYAHGPGAAMFFGRFCHGDPELECRVRALVREEDARTTDAIHAEIGFVPPGRVGNLVARPVLRDVELALHGHSAAPEVLDPADLLVSVVGGEVVLRSRRDGRRVVPRLTSMHVAYADVNLPLYHFLYQVQDDGPRAPGRFDWGPLSSAPFLPRVVYGGAVLSLARWRVTAGEAGLDAGNAGVHARRRATSALRARMRIQRHVYLSSGDNDLLLDLDDPVCVELLARAIRKGPVTLTELYPQRLRGEAAVAGRPELDFANEVVIPLVRVGPLAVADPPPRPPAPGPAILRRLGPGSECLYARVFAAADSLDALLTGTLATVLADTAVSRWFFVRYRDGGGHHLRLRLFGEPNALRGEVLAALHAALSPELASGRVSTWDVGTYVREVERYGGPAGMVAAEEVFWADSAAAFRVVSALAASEAEADKLRWRHALAAAHRLLDDFALPLEERAVLLRNWTAGWQARLTRGRGGLQGPLATRYREHRATVESLLGDADPGTLLPPAFHEALEERSRRLAAPVFRLRALEAAGALAQPLSTVIESFAHMGMNRLLSLRANAQEMVLYDFLARGYASRLARGGGVVG